MSTSSLSSRRHSRMELGVAVGTAGMAERVGQLSPWPSSVCPEGPEGAVPCSPGHGSPRPRSLTLVSRAEEGRRAPEAP